MQRRRMMMVGLAVCVMCGAASPAWALDDAHWAKANQMIERGIAYLRSTQNKQDGSWSPKPGPAVTAMAAMVMLDRPNIAADDPSVSKAIDYIMSQVQKDGGIYNGILANYNTSICLSTLARVNDRPGVAKVIKHAQDFLKGIQWHGQTGPDDRKVVKGHPFYGGAGYGGGGRPDLSNTQMMLQGLFDSGVSCDDPAFKRAMVFISRCQGVASNKAYGDKIVDDGGFIYSTSINSKLVGVPASKANPKMMDKAEAMAKAGVDEATIGLTVSGLRTYGSMTYAGFKSYLYAQLDRNDPRVQAAYGWVRKHYTLDANPGLPKGMARQGLYYYYMTFARALDAWGSTTIPTADGEKHDWANDLIDALASRQKADGSWVNDADRWMESDPNLVTSYALIALEAAVH